MKAGWQLNPILYKSRFFSIFGIEQCGMEVFLQIKSLSIFESNLINDYLSSFYFAKTLDAENSDNLKIYKIDESSLGSDKCSINFLEISRRIRICELGSSLDNPSLLSLKNLISLSDAIILLSSIAIPDFEKMKAEMELKILGGGQMLSDAQLCYFSENIVQYYGCSTCEITIGMQAYFAIARQVYHDHFMGDDKKLVSRESLKKQIKNKKGN